VQTTPAPFSFRVEPGPPGLDLFEVPARRVLIGQEHEVVSVEPGRGAASLEIVALRQTGWAEIDIRVLSPWYTGRHT